MRTAQLNVKSVLLCVLLFALASCKTVTFVQPYDDALVTGTQNFYKEAAAFVEQGRLQSPASRPNNEDPSNGGHLAQYQSGYSALLIEVNGLIIRAMVNSVKIGELGQSMQNKVSNFIDEKLPSVCMGDSADLGQDFTSLTVKNYADLKCVVSNWQSQHEKAPAKTLTSFDWGRRHRSLLQVIIAIQQAESFKQVEQKL